jgi:hypothetical protein
VTPYPSHSINLIQAAVPAAGQGAQPPHATGIRTAQRDALVPHVAPSGTPMPTDARRAQLDGIITQP